MNEDLTFNKSGDGRSDNENDSRCDNNYIKDNL